MYIGNPESLKNNYEKQGFVFVENLFDETNVICLLYTSDAADE